MSDSGLPPLTADTAWACAEQVARRHRDARLHEQSRRRRRDKIFRPVVTIVWTTTVVLAVMSLAVSGDRSSAFEFAGYGSLVLYTVVGGWWVASSGRYVFRGSPTSIRAAIPRAAQKSVRRQLALREPVDPEHADVVLELAHQCRGLVGRQLALYGFYVPLFLEIARNSRDWIGPVSLAIGAGAFIVGVVLLAVTSKRLTILVRSHADDTPSPARLMSTD